MKKFKLGGFGKRQITLLSLVALIAIAGYINLTYDGEEFIPASVEQDLTEQPAAKQDDYFTATRLERERSRSAAMDVYREVADDTAAAPEATQKARQDLIAAAAAMEAEAAIEGLIKAKGFEDAVAYLSDGGANVVVKTLGLTQAQATQIKEIVHETGKIPVNKIKIVEIK